MSNYEVLLLWFKSLGSNDFKTAMDCLDKDIEWVNIQPVTGVSDIIPWIGTAYGIDEVEKTFGIRDNLTRIMLFKPGEVIINDDSAVGFIHEIAEIKETGESYDITFATWIKARNGKIVRWQSFCDPSQIIKAFRSGIKNRLYKAIENDDLVQTEKLLNYGVGPNFHDGVSGMTPLMLSSCRGNYKITKALLDSGADVFVTDRFIGVTALHKACQSGNIEIVELLLDNGAFIDAVAMSHGHTPVMDALWYKNESIVKFLIERGANLEFGTHYGFMLDDHLNFELNVNQGEEKKKFQRMKDMIDHGREVIKKEIASQVVMEATNKGDFERVKKLIKENADVNTNYPHINSFLDGHTPLLVAVRDGYTEIVRELLDAGAKVRVIDWIFNGAPIHKATYNGRLEILKILVNHPDIDLNIQGNLNGYTPLHDALWHGYSEISKILIEKGVRLDLIGHDGKSVYDVSKEIFGEKHEVTKLIEFKQKNELN